MAFFTSLALKINPQFTDENGASLVISDNIYYMLLTETFFKSFITKKIADANEYTEVINALGVDSRVEVDTLVDKAFAAGAKKYATLRMTAGCIPAALNIWMDTCGKWLLWT